MQLRTRFVITSAMMLAAACQVGGGTSDSGPSRLDASGDSGAADAARPDGGPLPDAGDRLDDVLIYAHSADTLYEFSPYMNTVTEIGQFTLPDGSVAEQVTDLAVDGAGRVFTITYTTLYVVDEATAEMVPAMEYRPDFDPDQDPIFALSFIPPDQSPTGAEILVGATNSGELFEFDLVTDRLIPRGRYPDNWGSSGDITSVAGLGTFATVRQRDSDGRPIEGEPDAIAEIVIPASGDAMVRIIGTTRTAGGETFTALFGLGYWGRDLYGFSSAGELLKIDRETGVTELVSDTTGASQFYGAGVTTRVPFLI